MLSKNPLDFPSGRKFSKDEIAEALRLAIIAELDAVNLYLQLARAIEDERIRTVFEDIANEEKTHVGEFLALLKSLDPRQVEELRRGAEEVEELTGLKISNTDNNPNSNTSNNEISFENVISSEVKKLVDSARILVKKLPVTKVGRGADAVPLERLDKDLKRSILTLHELSYRFRVSQKSIDYALKANQSIEMPEAVKAALALAAEEDRTVVESLIKESSIKLPLGLWNEPGESVLDIAKAISELANRGFRRPYALLLNPARYVKLLSVSEKTGLTDLERIKMLVDEVIMLSSMPVDKVIVTSATPEVVEVVYGGKSEVDYIGPEDGYHVFRLWSSVAIKVKNAAGIVVMESKQ